MSSRDLILKTITANKPAAARMPDDFGFNRIERNVLAQFTDNVTTNGGVVSVVKSISEIDNYINVSFKGAKRIINTCNALHSIPLFDFYKQKQQPKDFEDVNLVVLETNLGVSENGAIWITDNILGERVLPFITQHLIIIIRQEHILQSLYEAYKITSADDYGFGVFIAGPSKTADIEQSLVIGAHGARSLRVFVVEKPALGEDALVGTS